MIRHGLTAACIFLASPALSDPLQDMAGTWRGTGWAKRTADSAQEPVKCRLKNTYDASARRITVAGKCVVPGRKIDMAGHIEAKKSGTATGRWFNPDGLGSTKLTGTYTNGRILFSFRVKDPKDDTIVSQSIEWTTTSDSLRMRSADTSAPDVPMADIRFTR